MRRRSAIAVLWIGLACNSPAPEGDAGSNRLDATASDSAVDRCPPLGETALRLEESACLHQDVRSMPALLAKGVCVGEDCGPAGGVHVALDVDGSAQARLENVGEIRRVCVALEHSWAGDLDITLRSPDRREVVLQGRGLGGENFGVANDCDEGGEPVPGFAAYYCWSPSAERTILDARGEGFPESGIDCACEPTRVIPATETYAAVEAWDALLGAPLNGAWTIVVRDGSEGDNGHVFGWAIEFEPVEIDCL
ncbi:MAG: hypothetical protein AAGE52_31870 [Myxococcota bacterium]